MSFVEGKFGAATIAEAVTVPSVGAGAEVITTVEAAFLAVIKLWFTAALRLDLRIGPIESETKKVTSELCLSISDIVIQLDKSSSTTQTYCCSTGHKVPHNTPEPSPTELKARGDVRSDNKEKKK